MQKGNNEEAKRNEIRCMLIQAVCLYNLHTIMTTKITLFHNFLSRHKHTNQKQHHAINHNAYNHPSIHPSIYTVYEVRG